MINIYRLFLKGFESNSTLKQYFSEETTTDVDIDTRSSIIKSLKKFHIQLESDGNKFTFYQIQGKVSGLLEKRLKQN